jgi:radical SAM protein with 4Fe4S-binding SPASM domain
MNFDGLPIVIGWELTLACNIRCRHCGSTAGEERRNELSLTESLAICDEIRDLLVSEVDFTGGEPLMKEGWDTIAARLTKLGITTKLLSNGLLLNEENIKRMQDAGVSGVGISIDGPENSHDFIRGRNGMYRKILESIERVQSAGLPLTIITTVNGLNVGLLWEIYNQLKTLSIERWQIQPLFPYGRSHETEELALSDEQYLELGRFYQEWSAKEHMDGPLVLPADSFGYFTELDPRDPPWNGCPAGLIACGVTSDGRVKGCLSMPDNLSEGDVRSESLWKIWTNPDSFAYNRKYRGNVGRNCVGCEHIEACNGGCAAMSYGYTGVFHNDPFCFTRLLKLCRNKAVG